MEFMRSFGFKLGLLFAFLSLACAALVYTFPGQMLLVVGYLAHSTIAFAVKPFNILEIIIGAAAWFLIGLAAGLVFEKIGECCDGKK